MALSRLFGAIFRGTSEILPGVYQVTVRGANVVLICEEELTLIDAGFPGSSAQIGRFIASLGRSVAEISLIILTHSHFDHAGGLTDLRKLSGARVAAYQDGVVAAGESPQPLSVPLPAAVRSVFSVKLRGVDIALTGGEVLAPLGGLEVIHTPGHTADSISLFSRHQKLLVAGDALNRRHQTLRLPPRLVSTDIRRAITSVKDIARLEADILCLGHGRPLAEDVGPKMQELLGKVDN